MHRKSKRNVIIHSSTGQTYTTRRGARRLIYRGLAVMDPDGTLRMIESDHRFRCERKSAQPPRLRVVPGGKHGGRGWPHGFAHFPLVIQTSSGQLRRAAA